MPGDDRADAAQALVPGDVTVPLVERLEMIDIDHQHCKTGLSAPGAAQFRVDEQIELTPVGQPRQCILHGQ